MTMMVMMESLTRSIIWTNKAKCFVVVDKEKKGGVVERVLFTSRSGYVLGYVILASILSNSPVDIIV